MEKDLTVHLKDGTVKTHSQVIARDSSAIGASLLAQKKGKKGDLEVTVRDVCQNDWELAMKHLLPGRGLALEFDDTKTIHPVHKRHGFLDGMRMCETVLEKMLMHPHVGALDACHCCLRFGIHSQTDEAIALIKEAFGISPNGTLTRITVPFVLDSDNIAKFFECSLFLHPTPQEEQKHRITEFKMSVAACALFHRKTGKNSQEIATDEEILLELEKKEMDDKTAIRVFGEGRDFCEDVADWLGGCCADDHAKEFTASPDLFHVKAQCNELE